MIYTHTKKIPTKLSMKDVKAIRANSRLSIKALAKKYGVSLSTIYRLKNNQRRCDPNYIVKWKNPPFDINLAQSFKKLGYSLRGIAIAEYKSSGRMRPYATRTIENFLREAKRNDKI